MWQGESRTIRIPIKKVDGTPINAASAIYIHFWVGKSSGSRDGDVKIRKSKGSGITVASGDDPGLIDITLDPPDTATLEPGSYYLEVEVKDEANVVAKTTIGALILNGSSGGDFD
jgi:hypothetical protein